MYNPRTTRIAAGALVIAAHCLGILLLPPLDLSDRMPASPAETTLIYLEIPRIETPAEEGADPEPDRIAARPVVPGDTAPTTAITLPPPLTTAPPDWRTEADLAVARYGEQLAEEDRLAASMGRPEVPSEPLVAPTTPGFGWSKAHTERVSALEGGGTMIRLSERCVIVIVLVPLPACAFGKIKPRSDLFEHMDDPPVLGDWKY